MSPQRVRVRTASLTLLPFKKIVRQRVIFNGTRHQAFGKEHLQQPIEITLKQDNEPELLNINVTYLLLKEEGWIG